MQGVIIYFMSVSKEKSTYNPEVYVDKALIAKKI